MKFYYILLLLATISFPGPDCYGQHIRNPRYQEAILEGHRLIDSLQQIQKIPGIDVAVSIKGEIVWSEGFGFADLEHFVPVIPGKTRFRIGSVSKPLTSAALGRLMDMGKIDLNSPVQTYVPYFPVKKYPITTKQAGGHIAGIRHYRGDEFLEKEHYKSVKSGITIFADDSLLFEPGSQYSYSSYGFNLVSAAIEGAGGEDFLQFIQREVFSPLGMTLTCPDKNDSIIVNRTSFYQLDQAQTIQNAPYVDNSYKWAGGGFISTTTDMVKFGEAHFSPGFLSANTLKELTTSQVLNNGNETGYGIGWRTININGLQGFGHGGGSIGGITQFQIYPGEQAVIVLLSNSSDANLGNLANRIIQTFIETNDDQ